MKKDMKKKQDENVPGGLLFIITGAAILYAFSRKKKPIIPKSNIENTSIITTPDLVEATSNMPNVSFPLRFGMRGNNVKKLQQALLKIGGNAANAILRTGGVDGIFGKGTQEALKFAKLPGVITEDIYNRIIRNSSKPTGGFNEVLSYIFVDAFFGASLYKNVNTTGGSNTPEFSITKLPDNTYIGLPTGLVRGDFMEVQLKINNDTVRFWVNRNDTKTFTGKPMDFDDYLRKNKKKTKVQLDTIVRAFN